MTTFTQEQNMMLEESAPTMLEEFAMPLLDLQKWLIALKVPADQVAQQNAQLIQLAKVIDDLEHVEAPSDCECECECEDGECDCEDCESEDDESCESEDDESCESEDDESCDESEDDESCDESEDDESCDESEENTTYDEEGDEEIWHSMIDHE